MTGSLWVLVSLVLLLLVATFWVLYLVKIVLNDEAIQEQLRRRRREIEEKRREAEDRLKKRREDDKAVAESVERTDERSRSAGDANEDDASQPTEA